MRSLLCRVSRNTLDRKLYPGNITRYPNTRTKRSSFMFIACRFAIAKPGCNMLCIKFFVPDNLKITYLRIINIIHIITDDNGRIASTTGYKLCANWKGACRTAWRYIANHFRRQQKLTAWHCTHFTFKVPEKKFSAQNHYRRWKVDSLW